MLVGGATRTQVSARRPRRGCAQEAGLAPDPTARLWGHVPEDVRLLLRGLLQPRPEQRLSLEAALASPYMARCATSSATESIPCKFRRRSVSVQS